MTMLPIPTDCVALDELPPSECPTGVMMELLGSLQHPYIYPVLDLGFMSSGGSHYACLVMPFNQRGSLKDLIYKVGCKTSNILSKTELVHYSGPMERAQLSQVHSKVRLSAAIPSAASRSPDPRSVAVSARSRISVARPSAQRQCYTAERSGSVS